MTTPRSYQIDLNATSYYHCIARCVRRSFLCGYDALTKKDFSHRRQWIIDRIKHLNKVFFIDICAYAIMSNHYHLVLHVESNTAQKVNLEELLCRWQLIFPDNAKKLKALIESNEKYNPQLKEKISFILRERLCSISWFMRCLNEMIAKMANEEDNCKGHFWEGRFKSQALLDEGALLSTMVYVDLNPIRAGLAITPESSDFTSIQERIQHFHIQKKDPATKEIKNQPRSLMPFSLKNGIDFSLEDYLTLVDTTGRLIRNDKAGSIPENLAPILDRLQLAHDGWFKMIAGIEKNFYYAIGNLALLKEFIPSLYPRRAKCMTFVTQCYQEIAA